MAAKLIAFKHQNYGGDARVFTSSDAALADGWNNEISSVIVVEGSWTMFGHRGNEGSSYAAQADGGSGGDGCYGSYNDWGGSNNEIGSIKLN